MNRAFGRAIKKYRTKYSAKLNSSFKIPRIFALEQILDLTKAEMEILLCFYESCNQRGIIHQFSHSQYVNTFGIPWESWMRGFDKLEDAGLIIHNERTRELVVTDYWRLIEKNSLDQKGAPLSERNNLGGYIKASWKLILSGKLRKLRPRAMRIFLYCYARIDQFNSIKKNHAMLIGTRTLCEMFRLAPCELEDYLKEIIALELLNGEYDEGKKQWEFTIHPSIVEQPEDTLTLLAELQKQGGAKLEWISTKVFQLLQSCSMLTKVKPFEAMEMLNLSKKYGFAMIERILIRLRLAIDDEYRETGTKKWPDKFIPWLKGAIDNQISERILV